MKKAFSLIELSIVILIIGILIAGVAQSSRLIAAMRVQTARQITQSSPVASIKDLSLWLESSMKNSFPAAQQEDGLSVTNWYDINPQSITKNNLSIGSASPHIKFKANAINNIPALYFDGDTSTTDSLVGDVIVTNQNEYSIFLVLRLDEADPNSSPFSRFAFVNGDPSSSGLSYAKWGDPGEAGKRIAPFSGTSWNQSSIANSTNDPEIIFITGDETTIDIYINGIQATLVAPTGSYLPPSGNLVIGSAGGGALWHGPIAEVIMFDRKLENEEWTSVKKYLAKKYNIKVS